jgi:hypothetical protein
MALYVPYMATAVALIPSSVEVLSRASKLNDQISGEVFGLNLPAFLTPKANQGGFIVSHDDPGVGPADK